MTERHPTLVPDAPLLRVVFEVRWRGGAPHVSCHFDPPLQEGLPPELEGLRRRILQAALGLDPQAETGSVLDCDDTDTDPDTDGDSR